VIATGVLLAVVGFAIGRARDARLARMIGREVRRRDAEGEPASDGDGRS